MFVGLQACCVENVMKHSVSNKYLGLIWYICVVVSKVHEAVPSIDCGYLRDYGVGHDGPCPQVRVPLRFTTSTALLLGPSQEW